ncbi:hypothetical protein IW261DRAFT_1429097 [Armillaria novae-zelandiae]|uniref:Uncharacterized protein n=1 Tax=Armillaria novae-zelandiae TaxID=153914 RepID=A0AA39KFN3_9AGAR|nr:hypothetical protein IW261DRAFT_1429097 [Armillaria novae-zelandiae]
MVILSTGSSVQQEKTVVAIERTSNNWNFFSVRWSMTLLTKIMPTGKSFCGISRRGYCRYITKKMALAGWCTPEQSAWFTGQLVKFHIACLENTVGQFLAAAVEDFMKRWPIPECAETIASNSPEDIAKWAVQDLHYQKWKEACLVAAATASSKSLTNSPKKTKVVYTLRPQRRLRAVQIYSRCYYKERVRPAVKKAIRQSANPLSHGQKLTIINKITHDTFQSESEEIKAEVLDALEQLREEQAKAAQKGEQTPEDYLDAIDATPALLKRFLGDLAVQTGWWFSVIAGGPDPADGGNIHTGSFHVGMDGHKRHFEDEYVHHSIDPKDSTSRRTNFKDAVIVPYGRFLKTLFSPEVRAQRACNLADLKAFNETFHEAEPEAMPGTSGLIPMPPSPPSPPSPPLPSCRPPSTLVAAISPTLSTPRPVLTSLSLHPSTPTPTNADTSNSNLLLISHPELFFPPSGSGRENGGDEFDPKLFWQDATFGQEYFAMGATERDRLVYDDVLGRVVLDHEGESFPLPGAMDADGDVDLVNPPEPAFQLPRLPSSDQEYINEDETDAADSPSSTMTRGSFLTDVDGELTPVQMVNDNLQKRHHEAVEGDEAWVDDGGGEDHERRMSKRT